MEADLGRRREIGKSAGVPSKIVKPDFFVRIRIKYLRNLGI